MRPLILLLAALTAAPALAAQNGAGPIVYSRRDGERYVLHTINADGTGSRELPGQTQAVNAFPAWSPDGKRIAFIAGASAASTDYQLYVMNPDGTGLKTAETGNPVNVRPAWSPDGKTIAFISGGTPLGVYLWDVEGGGLRRFTQAGEQAAAPFWTKDGRVGYSRISQDGAKTEIVLAKPDGTGSEVLVTAAHYILASAGAVSPDGKHLLYFSVDVNARTANLRSRELAAMAENILGDVKLSDLPSFHFLPTACWSPDGKSVLVSAAGERGAAVFRFSEDGQMRTRLTAEGVDSLGAFWRTMS
jgi:TolB protein